MILFLNDFKSYPTAIIDTTTKNKSFVRLAAVYKKMGIKNHAFILALINPELQGVDPHDEENLTHGQKLAIAMECKINPWYFVREVARAPARGTFKGEMVEANRGNIALWWCFFNHIWITLIQPRQTGKSMSTDVLMEYLMNILCLSTTIDLVTKDDKLRIENVKRLRGMMALLPSYIYLKTAADAENTEEITVKLLRNHYRTHVPRSSPRDAHNMGRGLTTPIIQFDEPPFQPNVKTAMDAAFPGMDAAIDIARKNDTPYGLIFTTTAGMKDTPSGKFIYEIVSGSAFWSERFLDAMDGPDLERMVRKNNPNGGGKCRINATFSHRQLGKTDEWLAEKLEKVTNPESINADYFNIWGSGGIGSPFKAHIAKMIRDSQRDVVYEEITAEGYILRWFIEEHEIELRLAEGKYVMGMDTSEAGGGDAISMILIDIRTGEPVCTAMVNETNTLLFAMWLAKFILRYPNIIANIERRSTGGSFLDHLIMLLYQHGEDPFKRLFNRVVDEYLEYPERYSEVRTTQLHRRDLHFYTKYKTSFGFATSGSGMFSRSELYSATLHNAVKKAGHCMYDIALIDQTLGLITKNGRIDHEAGRHDDMTIGWLMAMWFILQGRNLSYYGIDSKEILCMVDDGVELTKEEYHDASEQWGYRQRVEQLSEDLSKETNEFISLKIEKELRLLSDKIILEEGEMYSVDQLIKEVNHQKKKTSMERRRDHHGGGEYNPYGNPYGTPNSASNRTYYS